MISLVGSESAMASAHKTDKYSIKSAIYLIRVQHIMLNLEIGFHVRQAAARYRIRRR